MAMSVNTNFTSHNEGKQKKVGGYGAHLASLGAAYGVTTLGAIFIQPFANKFPKIAKLPDDQVKIVHEAGEKMLKQVGLADKVKIKYYPKTNVNIVTPEDQLKLLLNSVEQVKAGTNAFFAPKPIKDIFTKKALTEANTILMPEKDLATTMFHEIGHAMNYNLSKLGKIRALGYNAFKAMPIFLALYASITRKSKPDENGNLTTGKKINNFIRNNAGILSLAAFSPVVAEECIATANGKKYAQKLLSPELLQKYNKGTRCGLMTYIIFGLTSALAAHTAVKVKDKIIANKEAKLAYA